LAAARAAGRVGAQVTLIDTADGVGGQYWRQPPCDPPPAIAHRAPIPHRPEQFAHLRDHVVTGGAEILTSTEVCAVEPTDDGVRLVTATGEPDAVGRRVRVHEPDAVVLATGAHDRMMPFPGWELPGVYAAGAAQGFARGEGIAMGRRVIVAGTGPFLLPVAAALVDLGSTVVGVHEANRLGCLARGWLNRPWELVTALGKVGELAAYAAALRRGRVPWRAGQGVVAAHGDGRLEAVTVAHLDARWRPVPGSRRQVEVDALCVGYGFAPRLELALAAGCALTPGRFVAADRDMRTSAPGVWAAGEITGIGGVDGALAEGTIAGWSAAGGRVDAPWIQTARRRRHRADAFAERLAVAHAIGGGWTDWLTDATVLCRCEETTVGRLREVIHETGTADARAVKLAARVGLGPCQARMCGWAVSALAADADPSAHLDFRPIAAPVRLGDLARLAPQPSDTSTPSTPSTPSDPPERRNP
jgi:thioredoxin reductase